MLELLAALNDPMLVARFQRLCGIEGAGDRRRIHNTPVQNGAEASSRVTPQNSASGTNGFKNGHTNGHICINGHCQNGFTSDELKHRLIANGDVSNGVTGSDGVSAFSEGGVASGYTQNGTVPAIKSETPAGCSEEDYNYAVENNWLFYLFHMGANLGNEVFYITFYPYLIWNVDGFLGRRLCVFWALFMYLGQATKDIICWPRPASPPVFRLEKRYALEYGMPSTHAMVGAGMPFCLLYLTTQRYVGLETAGLVTSVIWCVVVCFSRIYLGMHSVLDVIAGLVYVFLLMPPYFWFVDSMDQILVSAPWAPVVIIMVPLLALIYYPKLDRWSTARGDTTLIVGTATGVMLGYWFCNQTGLIYATSTTGLYPVSEFTLHGVGVASLRLVLGGLLLVLVRATIKYVSLSGVCALLGKDKRDKLVLQSLVVELPTKFISYITIALACIIVAPQIFVQLGIDRPTYFEEM